MRKRRPLSVYDVGALLARSPHSREAILVGGQALNIWAVHYDLAAASAVVSNDIDFFGSRANAIAAGLEWGAEVRTPALDDHTPYGQNIQTHCSPIGYALPGCTLHLEFHGAFAHTDHPWKTSWQG